MWIRCTSALFIRVSKLMVTTALFAKLLFRWQQQAFPIHSSRIPVTISKVPEVLLSFLRGNRNSHPCFMRRLHTALTWETADCRPVLLLLYSSKQLHTCCALSPVCPQILKQSYERRLCCVLQAIRHLDGRDWNGRRLLVERARNVK